MNYERLNYKEGKTFLFKGVREGNLDLVKKGLIIVKDVNIREEHFGYIGIPLNLASEKGHFHIVEYLVVQGADVNSQDNDGWTPLHWALLNKHLEIVKYLISNGANVNIQTFFHKTTSLYLASDGGNLEIVKYLISNGAEVNSKSHDGSTPLHGASWMGHLEIVKYLISKGADVNAQDLWKTTPLNSASKHRKLEIVKYLMNKGADLNLENKFSISEIKEVLQPTKKKIFDMFVRAQLLQQAKGGVAVIGNIIGELYDSDLEFSEEELMAIATFGTQNRPKELLDTEEQKYQHLYLPLSEEYPHLFKYLEV